MNTPQPSAREIKAQIMRNCQDAPIQLVLSPEVATGLAFIAGDFAREVEPNCDEAKYLIALSEMVSIRLLDVLAARSPETIVSQAPEMAPELALAS